MGSCCIDFGPHFAEKFSKTVHVNRFEPYFTRTFSKTVHVNRFEPYFAQNCSKTGHVNRFEPHVDGFFLRRHMNKDFGPHFTKKWSQSHILQYKINFSGVHVAQLLGHILPKSSPKRPMYIDLSHILLKIFLKRSM